MLEELKTFISVVELKNFTKAGEQLNLSQPSVSTHIKNLEYYFGVTLINRSVKQKGIVITENGYKLYKRAKEMINLLDISYQEVHDDSDSLKGTLRVGTSLTIGEYILPKFLSHFASKYPNVDVEVFINNTSEICSRLKDLSLDIGLIEGPSSSAYFTHEYFYKDKMILAVPNCCDLLKENFDFSLLNDRKWIVREDGSGTREFQNIFLSTHKIIPKKVMVLGSNYAIKEAVKNNIGITIISDLVTENDYNQNNLSVIDLGENFYRHFSFIVPKEITISKSTEVFMDELKIFCQEMQKNKIK